MSLSPTPVCWSALLGAGLLMAGCHNHHDPATDSCIGHERADGSCAGVSYPDDDPNEGCIGNEKSDGRCDGVGY